MPRKNSADIRLKSRKWVSLSGQRFGSWVVLQYLRASKYLCRCDCGTERPVDGRNLRKGISLSCGCVRMRTDQAWNFKDLRRQAFGNLIVLCLKEVRKSKTYWLCSCICGKRTVVAQGNLKHTKSCGCEKYNRRLPESARNGVLGSYKRVAKDRNLEWGLTDEVFYNITQQHCHYCGLPPSNTARRKEHSVYVYSGVDRKDNGLGYVRENVVPCCYTCNRAKGTTPYQQFVEYIQRLTQHFRVLTVKTRRKRGKESIGTS